MAISNVSKGPIVLTSIGDATTSSFYITWIRWVGATAADAKLSVTDAAGDVIATSEADGANFIDIIPIFTMKHGITVSNMSSGSLYVYIR